MLTRNLRISYPSGKGHLVVRAETDWEKNIEAISVSDDGTIYTFELSAERPFLYVDPCLIDNDGSFHWAVGTSKLVLMEDDNGQLLYPSFFESDSGKISDLLEFPSQLSGSTHALRCYLPPGYNENTLAVYPVAFLYDTEQLLFPEEVFNNTASPSKRIEQMQTALKDVDGFIIVGIRTGDGIVGNDIPNYEACAQALINEIVPYVQKHFRIGTQKQYRSVWGTKSGGVTAFYSAWQYPDVFGGAVCMSSPFASHDQLMEQVLKDPIRDVDFYLDSQCNDEHQEETLAMAVTLASRGWQYGNNLFYQCFPKGTLESDIWGIRMQLPIQFLNGPVANATRRLSGENTNNMGEHG